MIENYHDFDELDAALTRAIDLLHKAGFKPNQPRVPAGNPDGGQWTAGVSGNPLRYPSGNKIIDPNTGKPYPTAPGMNIYKNAIRGKNATTLDMILWFQHYGEMDYQRITGIFMGQFRNVTNYNFGVVSAAAGYTLKDTLNNAGAYNRNFGRSRTSDTSYGIQKDAVNNITQGWHDYKIWGK